MSLSLDGSDMIRFSQNCLYAIGSYVG